MEERVLVTLLRAVLALLRGQTVVAASSVEICLHTTQRPTPTQLPAPSPLPHTSRWCLYCHRRHL